MVIPDAGAATYGETNALRNPIWLQGRTYFRDPIPVEIVKKRLEVHTVTSSLGSRTDRPYVKPGWANILERHEIMMMWPDLREPDLLQHLNMLAGVGRPFHVTLWKPVFEVFDGDASRKDFYLQRRLAQPYATPDEEFDNLDTRVTVYDQPFSNATSPFAAEPAPTTVAIRTIVHKTAATIGSGTPAAGEAWIEDDGHVEGDRWLTRVRLAEAPPAKADCLAIQYVPLYRVKIESENPRSYREALQEPRGLKFLEA